MLAPGVSARTFSSMTTLRLTALGIALLSLGCTAGDSATLALLGATLHDGRGAPAVDDAVVLLRDSVVACAGTREDCPVPRGVPTRDVSGLHLTPGLVDAHVHVSQTGWLDGRPDGVDLRARYPYDSVIRTARENPDRWYDAWTCAGITAAFDVGGMRWSVAQARRDATRPDAPHMAAAGPLITHAGNDVLSSDGDSTFITLSSADAGAAGVRALAAIGADAAKVWLIAPSEAEWAEIQARFLAVAAEARASGLPLIVHATTLREARAAVRAGAHMLVHSVESDLLDSAFVADLVAAGTVYVPTLIVGRNWTNAYFAGASGEAPVISDPLGCVDTATKARITDVAGLAALYENLDAMLRLRSRATAGLARDDSVMAENLRRVHAAGAVIAVGTDAGNPLTLHGASMHDELAAFERAGIPAESILVMATRNGARAMRREDFGTLETGKSADLLVLEDDPRRSSAAFLSRRGVMLKGRWLREP